jgi:hypothetical protein
LAYPLETPAAATDLISFLKALPDCRMRRGIRFPQWWMLLVAILAILSNQGSLLGMERFAKRHRKTLNELLGTHVALARRASACGSSHRIPPSGSATLACGQVAGCCWLSWTWRALRACSRSG